MTTITVFGKEFPAVVCDCGTKVWPASAMDSHQRGHRRWAMEAYGDHGRFGLGQAKKQKPNRQGAPRKRSSEKRRPREINIPMGTQGAR